MSKTTSIMINVVILAALCYGGWVLTGWLSGLCWVGVFFSFGATCMAIESKKCPACGERAHVSKGRIDKCISCKEYLAHTTDGYVHVHGAVVPDEFRWPDGCCVCGEAATRTFQVTAEKSALLKNLGKSAALLAVGVASVHTGGGTTFSVDVPHCDEHEAGAYLMLSSLAPTALMFCSEAYRDAFCELNAAEPKTAVASAT